MPDTTMPIHTRPGASAGGTEPPERFDPFSADFRADPYPTYHRFRSREPVHWGRPPAPGVAGGWYLFRSDDCAAVLRDPRFGREYRRLLPPDASPPGPSPGAFRAMAGDWMLFRDPPAHTRLRSLVNRAFTPRAVEALRAHVEAIAARLLDEATARGGAFDLIADYAFPLPVTVIAHILGVRPEDRGRFRAWATDLAPAIDLKAGDTEVLERADRATEELTAYLRDILADHRREPREDLIGALLAAEDGGSRLSEAELLATCVLLLLAGHETTVNLIGNGTLALLRHPAEVRRLRDRPDLIPNAVEELLRYDSPVQITFRLAFEDVAFGDKTIRRGEDVALVLGAANRDPARYPDPDRLDVAREPGRTLAFGQGIHYCLGAPLARLEGEVAFATLLRRFPNLQLATDTPQWRDSIVLRGLKALPVAG